MKILFLVYHGFSEASGMHRLMGQFSGGGDKDDDPQVDPNPDTGTDDNRSRPTHNVWDEEEEDY